MSVTVDTHRHFGIFCAPKTAFPRTDAWKYSSISRRTINGKCIDGYGDIYKYQIPGSEEKNMINIDNDVISKYKGEKIGTISENDLNEIKSSLNNMEYSTSKEKNENTQLSFIKVANKQQNNNDNVVELDYINDDFINIINDTSEYRTQNTSIASQKIMKILNKYNLSV